MVKKSGFVLAAVVVACWAAAASAQGVIVIGAFNDLANNTPNPDGWTGNSTGTTAAFASPPAPAGSVTEGNGVMTIVAPANTTGPGNNFVWAVQFNNGTLPTLDEDLASHPMLLADVTWDSSNWTDSTPETTEDNWAQVRELAYNSDAGWQQITPSADTGNPGFPGGWDSVNFPGITTRTVTWDLSGLTLPTDTTYAQVYISLNWGASFETGRVWVDNIRLVPEPTSLAMVGMLGLVPMLRRRCRRR